MIVTLELDDGTEIECALYNFRFKRYGLYRINPIE